MPDTTPGRPSITHDEAELLRDLQPQFTEARAVLDDLEEIGVDVSRERQQLDASEALREGMLKKFPPRGRKPRAS
jgi:hypothetical protein